MKRRHLAVAVCLGIVWAALVSSPVLQRLAWLSLDSLYWLHTLVGKPSAPAYESPAVVIAIDEETYRTPPFEGIPKVLWTQHIAKVLNAVVASGVSVIGFDIVFSTSAEPYIRGFDRELLVTLRSGAERGTFVLGMMQHSDKPIVPYQGYQVAVRREQNIRPLNIVTDGDGVIRRVPLFFRRHGADNTTSGLLPAMALEMAQRTVDVTPVIDAWGGVALAGRTIAARPDPVMTVRRQKRAVTLRNNFVVNLQGGPAAIPTYSLADLYQCVVSGRTAFFTEHFAGKAVMFGTVLDVEDRVLTGVRYVAKRYKKPQGPRCVLPEQSRATATFNRDTIPGVYVQAAAINTLVRGVPLRELEPYRACMLTSVLTLSVAVVALRVGPITSGALLVAGAFVWTGVATALFTVGWVMPLFQPMIASALSLATLLGYRFAIAERTGRHIRRAFDHYLAPAVVDRLVETNRMPKQGGELRLMTVWIADLENYTTLAEAFSPAELVELLNLLHTAVSDTVEEYGGFVPQFIGDAVVAAFGAPLDDPHHADHAVRAALACETAVHSLAERVALPHGIHLRNRIGISTGEMVVGNIGSHKRLTYTIIGDDINVSSRLEGANKIYGTTILASEATVRLCRPDMRFREIDLIRVQGRSAPVRIFEPLGCGAETDLQGEELLAAFAQALGVYRQGEFGKAAALFEGLTHRDPVAQVYAERARQFARTPPPADWDGVFVMPSK
jgi:class 3 adenylate cyclase/CHASE2 domain-containing sensor protein